MTSPGTIACFEHSRLPITAFGDSVSLSEREAEVLDRIADSRPGFCTRGHKSVQFSQYVGLVRLGDRVLEVLPKTETRETPASARSKLLRLLHLAGHIKVAPAGDSRQETDQSSLLEVFVSRFFDEVAVLVKRGLVRRYEPQEDHLAVVRGRILIEKQMARSGQRFDSLICRFHELSADFILNRAILRALEVVRPWIRSLDLARRRSELVAAFADVTHEQVMIQDVESFLFDRQTAAYRSGVDWAKLILRMLSPSLRRGDTDAPALLFDMNALFEGGISRLLRSRAERPYGVTLQHTGRHLAHLVGEGHRPTYGMRPDVVVTHGAEVVAVADLKWCEVKMDSTGHLTPQRDHMFQIQAYASVYPCEEFALIYPLPSGSETASPTVFRLPAIGERRPLLRVFTIDVGSDNFGASGPDSGMVARLLRSSSHGKA